MNETQTLVMLVILPILIVIWVMGWLVMVIRRGQPVKLSLKGFGVEVRVSSGAQTACPFRRVDDPLVKEVNK